MSSATSDAGSQIKRIPVKEPTWKDLHDLKEAGESYDELLSRMVRRERDYRDWKMVVEIEEASEFVALTRTRSCGAIEGLGSRRACSPF